MNPATEYRIRAERAEAERDNIKNSTEWSLREWHAKETFQRERAERAEADAAAMREALQAFIDGPSPGADADFFAQNMHAKLRRDGCDALTADAGTALLARHAAEVARLTAERDALARFPRVAKLLREGRPFFVVAADEPYAKCVAALIKNVEDGMGKWTTEDDARARVMLGVDEVEKTPPNVHTRYVRSEAEVARLRALLSAAVPIWQVAAIGSDTALGQKYVCIDVAALADTGEGT